ncbi:MAG: ABC transporter permease [Nitrospiraceae bacterium]|nr:MAG: ABC transporter permease [Nitrospiraceae bacterium]
MIKLLAVIERDIKKFLRNPVVIMMSLVMPLLYLVILGNSFQGKFRGIPIAVVNQDSATYATRMIENLRAIEAGAKTFSIYYLKDQGAAVEGVKSGIYKAALIIPPDFSRRVVLNRKPELGLFIDNTDNISAEAVRNSVNGSIQAVRQEYVPIRERPDEIHLRSIDLYSMVDYYQSLVPGVVIMAIFMGTMTSGVFNIVMDKFLGTNESYLLAPISRGTIVLGLIISGLIITTITALAVFGISMLITGIPLSRGMDQGITILLVVVMTTLALLSMMFVFLGRANHPRVVGIFSGFLNVIFFFPSGAVYPIESFPDWLKAFSRINPEAYAVHALKSVLFKDAGLRVVSGDIIFLLAFTALMMVLAITTFKRTL